MVHNATVAGVPSWTPLGELTNSPDDGSRVGITGGPGRKGKGGEGKGKGEWKKGE